MIPLARAGCDQRSIGKGQMERAAGMNPHDQLGRLGRYHYTMPADARGIYNADRGPSSDAPPATKVIASGGHFPLSDRQPPCLCGVHAVCTPLCIGFSTPLQLVQPVAGAALERQAVIERINEELDVPELIPSRRKPRQRPRIAFT